MVEELLKNGASLGILSVGESLPNFSKTLFLITYLGIFYPIFSSLFLSFQNGESPLHAAIMGGHVEVVKSLVRHGADIMLKNQDGTSCLELGISSLVDSIHEYFFNLSQLRVKPN